MNVGFRAIEATDVVQSSKVPVWLLYPTRAPSQVEKFGPFAIDAAVDAAVDGERLPLVVISHGTGSRPSLHRGLATHMARSGIVAALIEHPGNHRDDDSLARTAANLANRPRHVRLAIDQALADHVVGTHIARANVTLVGHSLGGYTALAVAGGKPTAFPIETADGKPTAVPVERDPRVRALVLLAPATAWYIEPGALSEVVVPILMRTGSKDVHADSSHAAIVERGLPDPTKLDHQVIEGAGHFSFLTPFPPTIKSPAIPPSQDPEGFDREAYVPKLYSEIVSFVRALQ